MHAWRIAAAISCCSILTTGCCMCQHPSYDCGPVWSQGVCQNCNPDYRAGSVLNRHGPGVLTAEDAPRVAQPAPHTAARVAQAARARPHGSDASDSHVRATVVAQQQRPQKRSPAERPSAHSPPKRTVPPAAPSPHDLPVHTVAAPPGTREGHTRILSTTDRRLDEPQERPKPVAAQGKSPQRTAEKPSGDFDGWRPVAPHQDPIETATQSRDINR